MKKSDGKELAHFGQHVQSVFANRAQKRFDSREDCGKYGVEAYVSLADGANDLYKAKQDSQKDTISYLMMRAFTPSGGST